MGRKLLDIGNYTEMKYFRNIRLVLTNAQLANIFILTVKGLKHNISIKVGSGNTRNHTPSNI